MADFLEEVSIRTRERIKVQKAKWSLEQLKKNIKRDPPHRSLQKALYHPGLIMLIAELKQASPSAGVIRKENDIPARVKAYQRGGASALSILTEEDFFHGSPHLLEEARTVTALPLLRKDFIIDPYQIVESKSLGADAVLLITALLPGSLLRDFIAQTQDIGLEALVEVHEERELDQALEAGAVILGINNRNLRTLRVDPRNAEKLLARVPKMGLTLVVESGIQKPEELPRLRDQGAHAVLIGETFMRAENPEKIVKEFAQACQK